LKDKNPQLKEDSAQRIDMTELMIIILGILILIGLIGAYYIGYKLGKFRQNKYWEEQLPLHRKEAILKSRSVLGGQFSEQLAPFLPDFKYLPTECKFMGKPVDLIIFKGMDDKKIEEIIFMEIKSGKSKLNSSEKSLKETIQNKRVKWEEYRIPEGLTKIDEKSKLL
jgi:predicted Holliday junction resolvase-like endonuclease